MRQEQELSDPHLVSGQVVAVEVAQEGVLWLIQQHNVHQEPLWLESMLPQRLENCHQPRKALTVHGHDHYDLLV